MLVRYAVAASAAAIDRMECAALCSPLKGKKGPPVNPADLA